MRYVAATTAEEASALLAAETGLAKVLGGGTDILVQMRAGMVEPALLVDIKKIPGLREIKSEAGGFRIGAGVSGAELMRHSAFATTWPGALEGFNLIGSTQVQGRATMAGNLCNASPAGDAVPGLVAAGATVRIQGPKGQRDCPIEDVPVSPGKTSLAKGEFITSIFLPAKPARTGDAYLRFIPRTEMDIAVASAGVCLTFDASGTCTAARVALGAVAPTVIVAHDAAKTLIGTKVDAAALDALQAAATALARPISDKRGTADYRRETVGVLARRAAQIAKTRAGA